MAFLPLLGPPPSLRPSRILQILETFRREVLAALLVGSAPIELGLDTRLTGGATTEKDELN